MGWNVSEPIYVFAAFTPIGTLRLVRETEGDCCKALCKATRSTIHQLKKRGYTVVRGTFTPVASVPAETKVGR